VAIKSFTIRPRNQFLATLRTAESRKAETLTLPNLTNANTAEISDQAHHTHETMKTKHEKAESVLNHKNWTGLSLAELVDAGRISPSEHKVIWSFTTATLGDPADMAEWQEMRKVDKLVTEKLIALEGGAK
jgi:hypothetical protein